MPSSVEVARPSADEALARLVEGNQRFLRGETRTAAFRRETLADLAKAQRPYATILGCGDSRVPPEWIFDAGLGELFVVRVAGNILSPEVAGSLQYAGSYLETPLFVVLGHEGCGAIAAALATKYEGEQFLSRVRLLLASVVPGLPDLDPRLPPEERLSRAVESNVRWTVRQILDSPEGQARVAEGQKKIVGAVYEIETGRVRFLPPEPGRMTPWPARDAFDVLVVGKRLVVPEIGFWGLPVFLLVYFCLFGVELIDSIVEDPFGRERDDLDLNEYARTIREGVEACPTRHQNGGSAGRARDFESGRDQSQRRRNRAECRLRRSSPAAGRRPQR